MNYNNLAMDSFNATVNCLTLDELRNAREIIDYKIQCRADIHRAKILEAIEAAINDGFVVAAWAEGDSEVTIITRDDGIHVEVN